MTQVDEPQEPSAAVPAPEVEPAREDESGSSLTGEEAEPTVTPAEPLTEDFAWQEPVDAGATDFVAPEPFEPEEPLAEPVQPVDLQPSAEEEPAEEESAPPETPEEPDETDRSKKKRRGLFGFFNRHS